MRKLILFVTAALCFAFSASAQNRTITGTVVNEKNLPMEGVSVTTADGKNGTQTDKNGQFSLTVPNAARVLVFSFVNYQSVDRPVAAVVNVTLQPSDNKLEEVVVVGYGVTQKKNFTGSASKVDVKQFANLMTASVDKQLAGRSAGVQITNAGGSVNTPAVIRIRGIASIYGNNDPLIVIDGMPVISGNVSATTNSNTLGDINPSDIESIDVLKDGSATAIYGSRGSAGVILITTKKGTKGRSRVTYDGFMGFSSASNKFDVLNASEFVTIANEKRTNAGLSILAGTNAAAPSYNTDWQDNVLIRNAPIYNHTISINGGSDKTTYFLSLNYSDQKGVVISNFNRAYRVRMNLENETNKFIKFGNNLSISRQEDGDQNNGNNSLGGAIASSLRMLPNVSPYLATGWEGYNINYNPNPALSTNSMTVGPNTQTIDDNFQNVAYTIRKNRYRSDKYRIINNAFVELSPARGLKIRSQVGIDMLNDYAYQGLNLYHGDGYANGSVNNVAQNFLRLLWSSYFTYNYTLKGNTFLLTGGYEAQKETYKWFGASGSVISDAFFINQNVISNSASTQQISGNYDVRQGFLSGFGRLNYDYKNKYFIQGSIRRDGQSSLAKGQKYGLFPGASIGWRPSQERFWQNSKILRNGISDFKVKASYAKVGNGVAGYPYLSAFGSRPYGNLGGLAPTGVGNPQLRWETSIKYDLGFEMGLFKNKYTLSFDYFLNDINNLILPVPQPLSAGIPGSADLNGGTISQNIGTQRNKGFEISFSGNIVHSGRFSWDFNTNYSNIHNKILSLFSVGGVPTPFINNGSYNIIRVGDPINILFGYQSAGVNAANGNPMFYKADGSTVQMNIDRTRGAVGSFYYVLGTNDPNLGVLAPALNLADKTNLGQAIPTFFGGFSNTFTYGGFSLDIMFRYSGGNRIMNYVRQEVLFNQSFQNNGKEILNRWTTPGQVTDVPKLYYAQAANINQTANATSRFVEKGDFIKLQNVVFSYAFEGSKLDALTKGYMKSARFFVQGQNLYTWSKYKGADPENINGLGVDNAFAPQVRTFAFGLSLGF